MHTRERDRSGIGVLSAKHLGIRGETRSLLGCLRQGGLGRVLPLLGCHWCAKDEEGGFKEEVGSGTIQVLKGEGEGGVGANDVAGVTEPAGLSCDDNILQGRIVG